MYISKSIDLSLANASWIRKLFEEGERMRQDGNGPVYDFSLGNPELEPPRALKETLQQLVAEETLGAHRYMPNAGYQETREQVATALKQEHGISFTANLILMTVGAAGAVNTALKTLIDPGDEVIVTTPYFVEYRFYIQNHGGEMVTVPAAADFDLDPEAIGRAITEKTRVVLINNPNNPTGVVYSQSTLNRLGEVLEAASKRIGRPIFLLDDAPYRKLVYDIPKCPSAFDAYENTLMATSHSKDLAVPGERIGFLAISPRCPGAERVADGAAFASRTLGFVNAPALMQRVTARLQSVTIDLDWYRKRRDRLVSALTAFGYEMAPPGGAFYLFVKAPGGDDISFIQKLKSMRVLVVPGSGFGGPGYFRIAYCVSDATIDGALPFFKNARPQ
jgi:aspartate aminotransferase